MVLGRSLAGHRICCWIVNDFFRRLQTVLVVPMVLVVVVPLLHANDRTIAQFVHTSWGAKDGVPGVYALAQTTDGFLWLGTQRGLYRFDGISFERYQPQSGPSFQSSNITALLAFPNGDLWIGYREKGVSLLRGGKNFNYTSVDGLPQGRVNRFAQDRQGTIWVGTAGGLARFDHDRWQRVGADWGYPGASSSALYLDRQGTLWTASEGSIFFLPPGAKKFQTTGINVGQSLQMGESASGALWLAETSRSVHPVMFPPNPKAPEPEIQVGASGLVFDDDGSLWITTLGDGMRRVAYPDAMNGQKIGEFSDAAEKFTAADGLTSDYAIGILKDREGNIWVGTPSGLDRFSRGILVPIDMPSKYTSKSLIAGDHGDIWAGSLSAAPLLHIEGNTPRQIPEILGEIIYAFRAPNGVIWFLTVQSTGVPTVILARLDHGKVIAVTNSPPGFEPGFAEGAAAIDRAGRLWLGGGGSGLFFFDSSKRWQQFPTPPGLAGKRVASTLFDANGRFWFGFMDNALVEIDGTSIRTFSAKDGIQVGTVAVITGQGPHLWLGGADGLALGEGDHFRSILPADGDTFHGVSGIQEDSRGELFVNEQRGVIFISAAEISKALKDPSARVRYRIFDARDGLRGDTQKGKPYPNTVQSTDGRIWFATSMGVVWVDPAKIPQDSPPPPTVIRLLTANGNRYSAADGLQLPPRTRNLTIDYTALDLTTPERVQFRYRLEGLDTQWQEAGTRRQAFYTNLGPGKYRFLVRARNNDGNWNETGADLAFTIQPSFTQGILFKVICFLAFAALVYSAYLLRVRQVTKQLRARMYERLAERERIARDLHDTFFQGIQGLLLRFHTATSNLDKDEPARRIFEETLKQSDQVMLEGRELVLDLRATDSQPSDLPTAIADFGQEMRKGGSSDFRVIVNGSIRPLHHIVFEELFKIGKEALGNAFRHSGAHLIEAELNYESSELSIRICDDGTGIESVILRKGHRDGHFGLPGMRERAQNIGAHLEVWSRPGAGTEVELRIAARLAFASERNGWWLWKVRRLWNSIHGTDLSEESKSELT
jgi:signal transduction histidine kinase/ligand-binding sensor domain-containing protein